MNDFCHKRSLQKYSFDLLLEKHVVISADGYPASQRVSQNFCLPMCVRTKLWRYLSGPPRSVTKTYFWDVEQVSTPRGGGGQRGGFRGKLLNRLTWELEVQFLM